MVLGSTVHLKPNALVNKHLVLALTWKLEALIRVNNVLPDLWDLDFLHFEELIGVVVFVSLDAVVFTELEGKQEELMWIFNKVIQDVNDLLSHLSDLD